MGKQSMTKAWRNPIIVPIDRWNQIILARLIFIARRWTRFSINQERVLCSNRKSKIRPFIVVNFLPSNIATITKKSPPNWWLFEWRGFVMFRCDRDSARSSPFVKKEWCFFMKASEPKKRVGRKVFSDPCKALKSIRRSINKVQFQWCANVTNGLFRIRQKP